MSFWSNLTHGFAHGAMDSMFGGFWGGSCCGFRTYCQAPMFFVPSVFMGGFFRYSSPMVSVPQLPTPQYTPVSYTGDVFVSSGAVAAPNFTSVNWDDFVSASPTVGFPQKLSRFNKAKDAKGKIGKWETKYDGLILKYAEKYGVDALLIKAVIRQESRFNPNATSSAGAKGLMQLMPGTAKEMGVTDVTNPEQNIEGGVKYLKKMLDKFNGNVELALAGYNAGAARVKNGQIPQNGETPKYVKAVMANYRELKGASA